MKLFRLTTLALLVAAQLVPVGAQEPPPPALTAELADYAALRAAKLSGEVAAVSNVVLKRDAGTFTLRSGELHFFAPVQGRVTGAVFVGDGEFTMEPPLECEKRAIAIFTREPKIAERFDELVLRFSDETWAEVKQSGATFSTGGASAARAAKLLEENARLLRERLRTNYALRTFVDVYSKEKERSGYFTAFVKGARFNKLIFLMDPRGIPFVAPEQVALLSYGDADGGIWASFPMSGGALADARTYDIVQHEIVAKVDGTKMTCTDTITLRATRDGVRVLPFDLFPALRVAKVTDASGAALSFVQQARRRTPSSRSSFRRPLRPTPTRRSRSSTRATARSTTPAAATSCCCPARPGTRTTAARRSATGRSSARRISYRGSRRSSAPARSPSPRSPTASS
jgi:hypothetical protein